MRVCRLRLYTPAAMGQQNCCTVLSSCVCHACMLVWLRIGPEDILGQKKSDGEARKDQTCESGRVGGCRLVVGFGRPAPATSARVRSTSTGDRTTSPNPMRFTAPGDSAPSQKARRNSGSCTSSSVSRRGSAAGTRICASTWKHLLLLCALSSARTIHTGFCGCATWFDLKVTSFMAAKAVLSDTEMPNRRVASSWGAGAGSKAWWGWRLS